MADRDTTGSDKNPTIDAPTHNYRPLDETVREHVEEHGSTAHGYDYAPEADQ